jgi:hypothetical protein
LYTALQVSSTTASQNVNAGKYRFENYLDDEL